MPEYQIGDVLISKETPIEDIKVGDDVSYLGKAGTFKNKVVTHRVIKVETDVDGNHMFHTKGIANLVADPVVYESQIYGVVKQKAVILSFVYKCVSTPTGMFLFIGIPILYVIGSEILSFMLEKEEERRKKLKEQKDKERQDKEKTEKVEAKTETKENQKKNEKETKKTKTTKKTTKK